MTSGRIFVFLSAFLFVVSSGGAAPFHEVRRDTVPDISNVTYIDPVLDWGSSQRGYVLTDSSAMRLLIHLFDRDTLISVLLPAQPVITTNRIAGDSLIIYILLRSYDGGYAVLQLGRVIIVDTSVNARVQAVPISIGTNPLTASASLLKRNLKFSQKSYTNDQRGGVIVEALMQTHYSVPGGGVGSDLVGTCILYDLSLDTIKISRPYSTLVEGTFLNADSIDYLGVMNLTGYHPPNDTMSYSPATILRGIRLDSSSFLFALLLVLPRILQLTGSAVTGWMMSFAIRIAWGFCKTTLIRNIWRPTVSGPTR